MSGSWNRYGEGDRRAGSALLAGAETKINCSRKPLLPKTYGINWCIRSLSTLDHLKELAEHQGSQVGEGLRAALPAQMSYWPHLGLQQPAGELQRQQHQWQWYIISLGIYQNFHICAELNLHPECRDKHMMTFNINKILDRRKHIFFYSLWCWCSEETPKLSAIYGPNLFLGSNSRNIFEKGELKLSM